MNRTSIAFLGAALLVGVAFVGSKTMKPETEADWKARVISECRKVATSGLILITTEECVLQVMMKRANQQIARGQSAIDAIR